MVSRLSEFPKISSSDTTLSIQRPLVAPDVCVTRRAPVEKSEVGSIYISDDSTNSVNSLHFGHKWPVRTSVSRLLRTSIDFLVFGKHYREQPFLDEVYRLVAFEHLLHIGFLNADNPSSSVRITEAI